jgi:hypothetical protein
MGLSARRGGYGRVHEAAIDSAVAALRAATADVL